MNRIFQNFETAIGLHVDLNHDWLLSRRWCAELMSSYQSLLQLKVYEHGQLVLLSAISYKYPLLCLIYETIDY